MLATHYDMANRLLKERQDAGSGTAREVDWTWTPDGMVDTLTHPDGTVVKNTYTARRRLNEVKVNGTTVAGHTYDAAGRRQTRTRGNGVTTTWSHDAADRISGINHAGVQQYTYGWTDAGDPLFRQDNTTPARSDAWTYDGMHRVADAKRGTLAGNTVPAPTFQQGWTLDKTGNWTGFNDNGTAETRTHGDHHELTGRSTVPNPTAFDANLNLTDDGSQHTYVYDAEDRLHEVRDRATTAVKARYSYDALGRRVKKERPGSTDVHHFYAGQQIIEERLASDGSVTGRWTYGDYVDEPITFDNVTTGQRYWYHQDHLFNLRALTDAAGVVVERYDYTTYGATTTYDDLWANPQTTSRVGNPFGYTGREWDVETGLYHYRARTYHPILGRFLQRDPLGYVDGPGLYEYVGGRATTGRDPSGHVSIFVKGFGGSSSSDDASSQSSDSQSSGSSNSDSSGGSSQSSGSESVQHGGSSDSGQGSTGSSKAGGSSNSSRRVAPTGPYRLYRWADKHFEYNEVDEAVEYIVKKVGPADKQCQPIVIVGHSWGGDASITIARRLGAKGYKVDFLATIDPVTNTPYSLLGGTATTHKPPTVITAWNWYQDKDKPGGSVMPGASRSIHNAKASTRVNDLNAGEVLGHRDIDDDPAIAREIKEHSDAIHKFWKP